MSGPSGRLASTLFLTALVLSTFTFALAASAAPPDIQRVVFVDYAAREHVTASAGTSCGDSGAYKLWGIKWSAFPVTYVIDAGGFANIAENEAKAAIVAAFNTWDTASTRVTFAEASTGTTPNVVVSAVAIDGPGGVLAQASVWYNTLTKAIVRAEVEFDAGDRWAVVSGVVCYGQGSGNTFDIQDVATHEVGHVLGLTHPPSSPKNVPLSLYAYASPGETYKGTLATGDQKGLKAIYG